MCSDAQETDSTPENHENAVTLSRPAMSAIRHEPDPLIRCRFRTASTVTVPIG
jgi:hypothetical protein